MARQYGINSEKGQLAQAQKMRQLEEEELQRKKYERYGSIAFLALGVAIVVFSIISANNFNNKTNDLRVQLQEAQTKLDTINENQQDENLTTVEIESVASSAKEAGEFVCTAQNDLNQAVAAEKKSNDRGTLSVAHQEALNRLRQYIVEGKNPQTARITWCEYGVWEFNGVYQFEGSKIPVVWKCYAPDDTEKERLLCFVKAEYDADYDIFTNAEIHLTSWYETIALDNNDLVNEDQADQYQGEGGALPDSNNVESDQHEQIDEDANMQSVRYEDVVSDVQSIE